MVEFCNTKKYEEMNCMLGKSYTLLILNTIFKNLLYLFRSVEFVDNKYLELKGNEYCIYYYVNSSC
jgi:hypothetical protein